MHYGLWHAATDDAHRARSLHTALAAVTIEKPTEDGSWAVWMMPHGEAKEGPLNSAPLPPLGATHEEYMELRAAVNCALSAADGFNRPAR